MDWLIFLSQLPSNPSSLRVAVWRKMRAAGALGLQNGTWIFPQNNENEAFLLELLELVQSQGASGQIFRMQPLNEAIEADLLARFQSDREQEYTELIEGCSEFLAENEKESAKQKFTFAELEEAEDDLAKLEAWQAKINKRDFTQSQHAVEAASLLVECRAAYERFSQSVYDHAGLPQDE
jgi:hypothetical protein